MQKRQAGTARGGKTGPRGRERLAVKMQQGGIRAPEYRTFSGTANGSARRKVTEVNPHIEWYKVMQLVRQS
ncbi:hypothetical protein GU926_08480 [Nibribacter ruber]|uniref:Uncharacterized protein n=1 Tax=Nibribacter ruber TaxID=2698458 RepID=A0A6P1NZT1_9BACT|nr:hypothetical protein [Nibribacter ruber]QHL87471.1 hypothetical protein GU926_08480 [Nibribacter ruber]